MVRQRLSPTLIDLNVTSSIEREYGDGKGREVRARLGGSCTTPGDIPRKMFEFSETGDDCRRRVGELRDCAEEGGVSSSGVLFFGFLPHAVSSDRLM